MFKNTVSFCGEPLLLLAFLPPLLSLLCLWNYCVLPPTIRTYALKIYHFFQESYICQGLVRMLLNFLVTWSKSRTGTKSQIWSSQEVISEVGPMLSWGAVRVMTANFHIFMLLDSMEGPIPTWLKHLGSLKVLNLNKNRFSGNFHVRSQHRKRQPF